MRFCICCGSDNDIGSILNNNFFENKKSNVKSKIKIVIIAFAFLLFFACIVIGIFFLKEPKSLAQTDEHEYKSAYVKLLYSIIQSNGEYLDDIDYMCFGTFNLDNDGVPELMVNYSNASSYFTEIYCYSNNKAKSVGKFAINARPYQSSNDEAYFIFVPEAGILNEMVTSSDERIIYETLYSYKKGKANKICKFTEYKSGSIYYIDDKRVTHEEYENKYSKYVPTEFDPKGAFDDDYIYDYMYELTQEGISEFYLEKEESVTPSEMSDKPTTTERPTDNYTTTNVYNNVPPELQQYTNRLVYEGKMYRITLQEDDWYINCRSSPQLIDKERVDNNIIGKIKHGTEIFVEYICDETWVVFKNDGRYVFSSLYAANDPSERRLMEPC